jgi:hypothetical protein
MPDALAAPRTPHLLANQQPAAVQLSAVTPGHGHTLPGKSRVITDSPLRRMLQAGVSVSQAVANELSGFNIQLSDDIVKIG